jgi:uncharacterized membrane protein YgdD (TMEM256/DUF423 family)
MTQSENSGAAILQTQAAGRGFIAFAALSGAVSVVAGSVSAHGLDPVAEAKEIGWLQIGSQYAAIHALAMLAVACLAGMGRLRAGPALAAQWLFLAGGVLFPGALYSLALHGPRLLGAVPPIGGTAFILGWLMVATGALTRPAS